MKQMQCKGCNTIITYNYHYECFNCSCGACYSYMGGELAPLHVWKDDFDNEEE